MTLIAGVLTPNADANELCHAICEVGSHKSHLWRSLATPGRVFAARPSLRLPQDKTDHQLLTERNLTLVGDIRIDNRPELLSPLGWPSSALDEKADSDFFLAAWALWGEDALRRLVGGFAVAIWDEQLRTLTLVRDHVGERPLYFLQQGETLAFSSTPAPLRIIPGIDTSLDENAMLLYLAIVRRAPSQTFFRSIRQLPVGHLLTFRAGSMSMRRYWHPLDTPKVHFKKNDDYVEAFRERFDQAVGARLRTTGRIGTQLSGGMDSGSVTATAARLLGSGSLTAFTSVPQQAFADCNPLGRFGNEGPAAARLAAMYPNIQHILIDACSESLIAGIEQMSLLQGHPVFNPLNQMWFKAIMDQARERGITVILQGACGNATLSASGAIGLSDMFQRGQWLRLAARIYRLRKKGHTSLRNSLSFATGPSLPPWLRRLLSPEMDSFNFAFSPVHPAMAIAHALAEKTQQEFFGADTSVEGFRRQMFDYYDNGFVNMACTLGWQVELRDPTQDKRIFEFCYAIPIEQYLVGDQTRSLVRRAMRGRVPDETLDCTTRGLQAADWFLTMGSRRGEMTAELASIRASSTAGRLLDLDRLGRLLNTWPEQGFERPEVSDAWHLALVRGLSAGNFIRHFE